MDADSLDFVSPPPDYLQLKCPICLELLLESPNLFSCCGNHVCGGCVGSFSGGDQACPMCKAIKYDIVINKSHQRAISSLMVYCSNEEKGCEWTGEVKQLETHLSLSKGNCQHEPYGCKYRCGSSFFRTALTNHETNDCIKRPISCEFCNEFSSTFDEVTRVHHEVCSQYPIRCPNDCGASVKRIVLDTHVSTHCPQRKVQCEFAGIGCKWFDKESELGKHLEEKWREHIAFAMSHSAKEVAELKNQVIDLSDRVNKLELELPGSSVKKCLPLESSSEDDLLKMKRRNHLRRLRDLSSSSESSIVVKISPDSSSCINTSMGFSVPFKIPDHSDTQNIIATLVVSRWEHKRNHNNLHRSPAFFINPCSRFGLQVTVHCNGIRGAKGSHVSVFANICFLRTWGVFGHLAALPELFSGKLLISLVSPIPEYENKYGLIIFDDTVDDKYRQLSSDNVEIGIEKFISFEEVDCYLRPDDGSLHFQIRYFELDS